MNMNRDRLLEILGYKKEENKTGWYFKAFENYSDITLHINKINLNEKHVDCNTEITTKDYVEAIDNAWELLQDDVKALAMYKN